MLFTRSSTIGPANFKIISSLLVLFSSLQLVKSNIANSGLEDDIHFLFKWPGVNFADDMKQKIELIDIATSNNEKYKCAIPLEDLDDESNGNHLSSKAQNEALIDTSNLINTNIYARKFCSYRIESYWIYELCHGQYVKQYHETKAAGKRVVTQEYFLGYYDQNKQEPDYFKQSEGNLVANIHWKPLKGEMVAMYGVKYTDGTVCEVLNGVHREITVFYACDEFGNDNIAAFEEISSCIYEMVVITKWICAHPEYKVPDKKPKEINCVSIGNSPPKPVELVNLEIEQNILLSNMNQMKMTNQKGETFIIHYNKIEDDPTIMASAEPEINQQGEQQQQQRQQDQMYMPPLHIPAQQQMGVNEDAQKQMINSFLSGNICLNGGSEWWKYEICLSKSVTQYHEDEKTRKRTNIYLGHWDLNNHLEWLNTYPNKRPLPDKTERTTYSLYYSEGDYCEQTNKKRTVEVKFRCIKAKSHAISLYLLEPKVCEYLLAIESPWLCDLVQSVDTNGLIATEETHMDEKAVANEKETEHDKLERPEL